MTDPGADSRLAALLYGEVPPEAADQVRRIIDSSGGRVDSAGEGAVLAEFASALEAMECARRMLDEIGAARLRLGLDVGEARGPAGRIAGEGVEVARRLVAFMDGTGLAISGVVHDQVAHWSSLAFDPPLARDAARDGRPARIFRARLDRAAEPPSPTAAPAEKPSIAVLPFANLSGDPAQDYFSDGIAEDITVELSRVRSLFVIARNSSFAYRGRAVDLRQIGRELSVEFVLEGSVRKSKHRVRITAQLEDARSGRHLWSERYDRELTDVFAVQDDVTRRIVAAIVDRVEHVEVEHAARRRPENLDAYDNVLRSLPLLRGYTPAENAEARQWLEKAVALDPHYAQAHALFAASNLFEWLLGADDAFLARAHDLASRAVALDENDSDCHQTLARVLLFRGDHDGAARHFDRALMLNPNDADLAANLGLFQAYVGRAGEGMNSIERAMRVNPNHPEWYWEYLGIAALVAGHFDRAIAAFHRLTASPSWIHCYVAVALWRMGRHDAAKGEIATLLRLDPDATIERFAHSEPFKNRADLDAICADLGQAGLPG